VFDARVAENGTEFDRTELFSFVFCMGPSLTELRTATLAMIDRPSLDLTHIDLIDEVRMELID